MEEGFVHAYRRARAQAYARWLSRIRAHEVAAKFGAALGLAIVAGVLAQVKLYTPLSPVPYTLQVLGVSLMGGLLGRAWGALSAVLYVLLGLVGLPLYAGQVDDAGGLGQALADYEWNRGLLVFENAVSAGFILGMIPMAFVVGWARDRKGNRDGTLLGFAPAALAILALFAILDAVALRDASRNTYYADATQAVFFAILVAGVLAVAGATAWLAYATRRRRERVELFHANVVGLAALYLVGAAWFYASAPRLGLGDVSVWATLRYTVFPFVAVDVTKILVGVALVAAIRPPTADPARRSLRGDTRV